MFCRGVFVRGGLGKGGFCPGGFCPGVFCPGGFVLEPFYIIILKVRKFHQSTRNRFGTAGKKPVGGHRVKKDIPLLLSKASLKKAGACLDLKNDKAVILVKKSSCS